MRLYLTHRVAVKNQQKNDFLHVFVRDATNITHIVNRRPGGESTHKITFFMHRSICGASNICNFNDTIPLADSSFLAALARANSVLSFSEWIGMLSREPSRVFKLLVAIFRRYRACGR